MELLIDELSEIGMLEEILHDVEALIDARHLFQREHHPTPQHTSTHWGGGTVDDVEQRQPVLLHGLQEFE